ncbi:MAG: T9SS type A sorting domain-containing protein [Candidatus Sabulitectum sp.]|nr:T9SS type A sorting domain-containing protein [Candidatus Sabulitectum sp.]
MSILSLIACVLVVNLQVSDNSTMPDDANLTGEFQDYVYFDIDDEISIDMVLPPHFLERGPLEVSDIEPGDTPEGDNLFCSTFSTDGSKVFVANFLSENISVIDWATKAVEATIDVGGRPGNIACSDEYAIVTIPFEEKIEIYNLSDYSLAKSFTVAGGQPWVTKISEDGTIACVASDVLDICDVIDLTTLTIVNTITDFPIYPKALSYTYETYRWFARFSDYTLTPLDNYIAVGSGAQLLFINYMTGNIDHTLPMSNCSHSALSGDGNYLIARDGYDPLKLTRVDLSTYTIESSVTIPGFAMGNSGEIAVNQDGTKAYTSSGGNACFLVKFLTGDFVAFDASTTASADWVASNYDHTMAISSQLRYAIIDFESETMIDRYYGNWNMQGCVSPVANNSAAFYPTRHEAVHCYSFDDTSMNYLASVLSGSPIEGDGTRRVAIAPDGSVAVVSNTGSDNVSILNMSTHQIDAVIEVGDRVQNAAITSDSRWAVVCGCMSELVKVIDLETNTVAASISTGDYCTNVAIAPDDSYAYVTSIYDDKVTVIELDGSSSSKLVDIPISGINGTFNVNCGVFNNIEVSPDGSTCIVAAATDDMVRVIDTATNTVVANVAVGNFPLHLTFNADGTRAIVSNFAGDSYSLLNIDGASSSVIHTQYSGDRPARVAYDSVSDQFAVAIYEEGKVKTIDPDTGAITGTFNYPGKVFEVRYTATGERLVLVYASGTTPFRMYRGTEYVDLNSFPTSFDYNDAVDAAVAAAPGPDYATVITYSSSGVSQQNVVQIAIPGVSISPNPGSMFFSFDISLPSASNVSLGVYDLNGRRMLTVEESFFLEGNHSISWNSTLPAGVYALRLDACQKSVTRFFTVCR